ncbi:MAG TPA: LPS assembly lipoprotein LptE [Xanthobacteraceae bacterium]|nr:LPS assembly lipoprotein LptE [Xanthobacteraceae bacterium]
MAAKIFALFALALSLGGCFQPLYGDRTATAAGANVKAQMASVDVMQIAAPNASAEARLAVELRNQLLFELTGGPTPSVPAHQLRIRLVSTRLSVIVDVTTARPDNEIYGLNAYYELVEMKTGKVVVKDNTFSRVSYDIPGQQQRFARARGLRDAENRAAQTIADNIRNRLTSYFTAGT